MTASDAMAGGLPEVSISEDCPVRHLHLGTPWVQGSMNLRQPYALELEYVRQEFETSLANVEKPHLYYKYKN